MSTVEEQLIDASKSGGVGEVKALLRDNPGLNINWGDWRQFTALHWAANNGHAEVVKLLLAHPDISVNVTDSDGSTPFLLACQEGQVSVVRMLLEDPRVDITFADENNCTPLWWAAAHAYHEVIEWLIASGRDLGDLDKEGIDGLTTLGAARWSERSEVALLERFLANPAQTRRELSEAGC